MSGIAICLGLSAANGAALPAVPDLPELDGLLEGRAIVGSTVTVRVGAATPDAGSVLWRADGQLIPAQTGASYTVEPIHDLAALTAEVGGARSEPADIIQPPPALSGPIADRLLTSGSGMVSIDLAEVVSGGGLTLTVEPIDAPIAIEGMSLLIDTAAAYARTAIEVRAANSGGAASLLFDLEIAQGPNQVIDFGSSTAQGHFRKTFATPLITQAELVTYAPIDPANPASLSVTAQGLAFAAWWNGNGAGGATLGGIAEDDNDYLSFSSSQVQLRRDATQETASAGPVADSYGWHFISASIRRRQDNGNALLTHRRDGAPAVIGTANGRNADRLPFMTQTAIGRLSALTGGYTAGTVFDFAVMRGNPDVAHAWCWNDGVNFRSLEDYDFANDPTCKLIALYRMKRVDPGTGNGAEGAEIENIVKAGDPRAGGFAPLADTPFIEESNVLWADQAPWQTQERLDVTVAPSISVSGDSFTANSGSYNAVPVATITRQAFWNGVEVALTGNAYTRPAGEAGQFVTVTTVQNATARHEFVTYDNSFAPGLGTGTGEEDAHTLNTAGLARDELFFVLPDGPRPMGYFETNGIFVVGAAAVRRYPLPAQLGGGARINGTMKNVGLFVNPAGGSQSGFDSRVGTDNSGNPRYLDSLNVTLPTADTAQVVPGDVLVAGVSDWSGGTGAGDRILAVQTLTCVTAPPKWDAFRPGYCGGLEPTWRYSDIDPAKIPALSTAAAGVSAPGAALNAETWDRVRRVAVNGQSTAERSQWTFRRHMTPYAGASRRTQDMQGLYQRLVTDGLTPAQKRPAIAALVQHGIDAYTLIAQARAREGQAGLSGWFGADGWWNASIMACPAVAGELLGDGAMRNLALVNRFQEIQHTFLVSQRDVTISNQPLAPVGTRYSVGADTSRWYPYPRSLGQFTDRIDPYKQGMIDGQAMPEWGSDTGTRWHYGVNAHFTAHQYRNGGGAHDTYGYEVLALLALGLEDAIGHPPYFQYHIRHIELRQGRADPWRYQGGASPLYAQTLGTPPEGVPTGNVNTWAETMRLHHFPIATMVPW